MSISTSIILIVVCIACEAFFSGSEIALVSVDRLKLRHLAKNGKLGAKLALDMLREPDYLLGTTLLGTNLATITNTTISASLLYNIMGSEGIAVAIAGVAFINWIFAEIVPKSVFQQLSDSITPVIIFPLRFFSWIFFPIVWLFSRASRLVIKIAGNNQPAATNTFVSKEEIKLLMNMKNMRGDIDPGEKKMINRLLTFNETVAEDVMVPLIQVSLVSDRATISDAAVKFAKTKHRRLPVFHERVDKITGVLNSFDVLGEDKNASIRSLIRPAVYIPPNMSIATLLRKMQSDGKNMAVVVDEYGGAAGIVTVEDILEEVVGEIEDEYDQVGTRYRKQSDGSIIISGRMEIDAFNHEFGFNIPEGDYDTIGGYIVSLLQRIPQPGEKIPLAEGILTVRKATDRIIIDLVVRKK